MADRSSGTHLWLVLMKSHGTLRRHAERSILSLDMCFSDFAILELLLHKGPHKLTEIGRRVQLTSGAITTAVDRLESRQLVTRGFADDDRRARIVTLTPAGTELITEIFAEHGAAMEHAASGLTPTERATLIALLKKLGTSAALQLETDPNDGSNS